MKRFRTWWEKRDFFGNRRFAESLAAQLDASDDWLKFRERAERFMEQEKK